MTTPDGAHSPFPASQILETISDLVFIDEGSVCWLQYLYGGHTHGSIFLSSFQSIVAEFLRLQFLLVFFWEPVWSFSPLASGDISRRGGVSPPCGNTSATDGRIQYDQHSLQTEIDVSHPSKMVGFIWGLSYDSLIRLVSFINDRLAFKNWRM